MSSAARSGRHFRFGTAIIVIIAAAEITIGIYHLTHGGRNSGTAELALAFMLVTSICLISRAVNNVPSPCNIGGYKCRFWAGLTIIMANTLLAFYFGVYHLSHQGTRSAIIELLCAGLLAGATYLFLRAWREARVAEVPHLGMHAWTRTRILAIASVLALILAGIAYAAVRSPS